MRLGHLRKTAEVNLQFLEDDTDTVGTSGHQCTKTLTGTKLQYLLSPWYMLGVNRADNSQAVLKVEFHRHSETCGNCNVVDTGDFWSLVCSCRVSQGPCVLPAVIVYESRRSTS